MVEPRPRRAPHPRRASTGRPSPSTAGWWRVPAAMARTVAHRANRNTKSNSRRNIARHYDLSNDLYRLFLDETLTYSSAVFETPDQSLDDAQQAKYRRMARASRHRSPGCTSSRSAPDGAASPSGRRPSSTAGSPRSPSPRRSAPSRVERIAAAGLADLSTSSCATIATSRAPTTPSCQHRDARGRGSGVLRRFFAAVDRALVAGRSAQHPDHRPHRRCLPAAATRRELDPEAHLPRRAAALVGGHRSRDAPHAAPDHRGARTSASTTRRTLRAWRTRFMANVDAVRGLGFDERFVRMWEYYLALCEAGFSTGIFQDLQSCSRSGAESTLAPEGGQVGPRSSARSSWLPSGRLAPHAGHSSGTICAAVARLNPGLSGSARSAARGGTPACSDASARARRAALSSAHVRQRRCSDPPLVRG